MPLDLQIISFYFYSSVFSMTGVIWVKTALTIVQDIYDNCFICNKQSKSKHNSQKVHWFFQSFLLHNQSDHFRKRYYFLVSTPFGPHLPFLLSTFDARLLNKHESLGTWFQVLNCTFNILFEYLKCTSEQVQYGKHPRDKNKDCLVPLDR